MPEEILTFLFDQSESQRLDLFLVSQMQERSRTFIQGLIGNGDVLLDGEIVRKSGEKLEGKHSIEVRLPPPVPSDLVPENILLDIVHEDKNILIVNKPAGMVVHPSAGHDSGTLIHAVLAHAPDIEGVGAVKRPGLIHRLDKDTSGLIVLAKNDKAHHFIQAQFKDRKVEKRYLALVDGFPPTPEGRIEASVGRDPKNRQKMAVVTESKGKEAVSEYLTKKSFANHSLLEIKILTGRTHQIRLHMAFIGCPVVGDVVYGSKNASLPINRQFLHAAFLAFTLPGQTSKQSFHAPLPDELKSMLDTLR